MKLSNLITLKYGKSQKTVESKFGYPIYGTGGIMGYANTYLYNKETILFGRKGSISNVQFIKEPFWCVDTTFYSIVNEDIVIPKYLYYKLSTIDFNIYNEGTTIPSLRADTLNEIDIDIHDKSTQQHIVDIIGSIDDLIEAKLKLLNKQEELEKQFYLKFCLNTSMTTLKDNIKFIKGKKPHNFSDKGYKYLTIDTLEGGVPSYTNDERLVSCNYNDLLIVMDGASSGKVYIGHKGIVGSTLAKIETTINPYFLYIFLKNNFNNISGHNTGSAIPHTNKEIVYNLQIPSNICNDELFNNLLKNRISIVDEIEQLNKLKQIYLKKFFG